MTQAFIRATVLLSGGGTNLQALIDASSSNGPLHNVTFVRAITDKKDGEVGLARAEKAGIPIAKLNQLKYRQATPPQEGEKKFDEKWRHEYDADLAKLVLKDEPELVICAGWL
jgi:phosphoribosylglycinamide formyltransferase